MKNLTLAIVFIFATNSFAQIKTWWFFGWESTTDEGITADVNSFKDAGFSGVVYYDQNHRNAQTITSTQPEDGFSPSWWQHLKFAAKEAKRAGLTFEMNISNGYVAGGKWIDEKHAMHRLVETKELTNNLFVLAIKTNHDNKIRHITARYNAKGKGRNGAMQTGLPPTLSHKEGTIEKREFSGAYFKKYPNIGMLQVSDDSINWKDVTELEHMYSSQGGYFIRTNAFEPISGKYFRINYYGETRLRDWHVGNEAKIDRFEELVGLHSDFSEGEKTPHYSKNEIINPDSIIDLTSKVRPDGTLDWTPPSNSWKILRLKSELTGVKSKHGRQNLLGYECDKLSKEAAKLHWDSYMQIIIDSLRQAGIDNLIGVTMDSHEGGAQNWTPLMLEEFKTRRGYDLRPYLPVFAGYIVESVEKTYQVMRDIRLTISDCIRDNYYGTFQQLARNNNLTFTAQAIGNALCIAGDAVSVKQVVDKPQGEFWTYQKDGAYDIKDCSSAAHLYGKAIASAEAMTDAEYKNKPSDLKRVSDIALSMGAQEFVICATPHIPNITTSQPYIAGREYAINRSNPRWEEFKPIWQALNRSLNILSQGKPATDILIYMGDDIPVKTLTHKLPLNIEGLDWDVCTGDALQHCVSATNFPYKALVMEDNIYISPESQQKIKELRKAGIPIFHNASSVSRELTITNWPPSTSSGTTPTPFVSTKRIIDGKMHCFIANITTLPQTLSVTLKDKNKKIKLYRTSTGKTSTLRCKADGSFELALEGNESVFCIY